MILNRARANADALKIKVPHDSVDMILARLRSIRADRREGANAWVVKPIAKKQRDMLSLLGLPLIPKTLRQPSLFRDQVTGSSGQEKRLGTQPVQAFNFLRFQVFITNYKTAVFVIFGGEGGIRTFSLTPIKYQ